MIASNGHEWKTIDDVIMLGNSRIGSVYAGNNKVYPDDDILAFWFSFPTTVTKLGSSPINRLGGQIGYNGTGTITKAAVCVRIFNGVVYGLYGLRGNFQRNPLVIGFGAYDDEIIYTSDNSSLLESHAFRLYGSYWELDAYSGRGARYGIKTADGSKYVVREIANMHSNGIRIFTDYNDYYEYIRLA